MTTLRALPAFLLLGLVASVDAAPLRVLDISQASAEHVDALKRVPADGWWLELGTQLVLVGVADGARAAGVPTLAAFDDVDPTRLMLRARGCSEHSTPHGRLLAQGGRWELREVGSGDLRRLQREPSHAWIAATPGLAVARRYRGDAARGVAPQPHVQQVVDRIDTPRWFADVTTLAGWNRSSYNPAQIELARDWIASQFAGLGLATQMPAFTMPQPGIGQISRNNVLGTWTGTTQPDRWIVVGAHYDARNANAQSTSPTPGAEDNASGCAGVIELARALLPSQPTRSILFLCYAGEEQGLFGSAAHVQALQDSGDIAKVERVLTMDMIGYSAQAQLEVLFETGATHAADLDLFGDAAATYAPDLAVVTSTFPFGSDHVPYLDAGLPAMLSIENDWDVYPHYHQGSDTPANMGPHAQAMAGAILRTNAAVLAEAAGVPALPFADGFEDLP